MHKSPNAQIPLNHLDSDEDFFKSLQFPIGYSFAQDKNTGVTDRSFREQAFTGDLTIHQKPFSLVNPSTGKALGFVEDPSGVFLIQQDYAETDENQQFLLNANDQLVSVKYPSQVITAMPLGGDTFRCSEGIGIRLGPLGGNSDSQKWRNYEFGLVNVACGRSSGNFTLTAIETDSVENIPFLDHISFSIVNRFNGSAITTPPAPARTVSCHTAFHFISRSGTSD